MTTLPHSAGRGAPRPWSASSDTLLERLKKLHPQSIDLSLGRIERLLAALGNPQDKLPPVVHVAGTNGKGSFLAFTRAIAEALGKGVHVYTSPHLVNFHERIVLAAPHGSAPIAEDFLVDCLARAEAANGGELITLFEITTAAAFLAFAETPADLLLLETGLGGRLDATNVVKQSAAYLDHADLHRPCVLSRRDPDRDRRREGRHLEARACLAWWGDKCRRRSL